MKKINDNQQIISLILKLTVIVCSLSGTYMSAAAGRHSFMGGSSVFMYFTIQSNLLIAAVCIYGAYAMLARGTFGRGWYVFKFVSTVSITLTGLVFCFVLAPTMGGRAFSLPNTLTHVVVPLAAVIDFFVTGISGDIGYKSVPLVAVPPIIYAIYAGIGYVRGWEFAPGINYPYFFLNWGSPAGAFGFTDGLPFMGCGWWILALLVLLMLVGCGYLAINNLLKKAFKK